MNHPKLKAHKSLICLLIILTAAWWLPSTVSAAKIPASEALAAAIDNGTMDQVKQDLLMDVSRQQKYEFDEKGMAGLGRDLIAKGQTREGVEVLQLNQAVHHDSPDAANALADGYLATGNDLQARIFYDVAMNMDPDNEHAKQATAELAGSEELAMEAAGAMGEWELDPEAMQEAMAQMGVEASPEQMREMQEAMAQLEQYQQNPEAYQAAAEADRSASGSSASQSASAPATAETQHESEFCEVLHRFNADKKIADPQIRTRVEGHYGAPADMRRTWNVESACGEFLVAVPLWADVSPPVMKATGGGSFEDAAGGSWAFTIGGDGKATGVNYTAKDGTSSEMKRLGAPKSFN